MPASVELGSHIRCLGGADPLEDLVCLAQAGLGLGGATGGLRAPAQARACASSHGLPICRASLRACR
jgi:hypothetical protein